MSAREFHLLEYLPMFAACALIILGSGVIGALVAKLFNYNPHAFIPPMMFPNVANMGIPLTLMAFGAEMLPVAISVSVVFSLFHYTIGIRICAPQASIKSLLKGPMLWAVIGGILVSLFKIPLPEWSLTSMKMLGETSIPLGLFALGVGFSRFRFSGLGAGIVGAIVRPLSGLLVAFIILKFLSSILPIPESMRGVLLLYAALPPAVMNYIFAEQYQQNPELVSAIVVVGNIASIFFVSLALYWAL